MGEEIIDSTFFNTYMSDLGELEKHRFGEDEPAMAEEAELEPQLAEEIRAFMNADDARAVEALVNALNQGQHQVFDIFIAHFQRQTLESGPDISQRCRTSSGSCVSQWCALLTGVAGTGKSHVVRLLIAKLRALGFGFILCGASGVAALNVGGRTMHSLFSLSFDLEWQIRAVTTVWWMIRIADMIIVDEFSLLPNKLLHKLHDVLHKVRRNKRNPFGGITVLLIDDPLQLPY